MICGICSTLLYTSFLCISLLKHTRCILWAIFNDNFDCVQFSTDVQDLETSPYVRDGNLSVFA